MALLYILNSCRHFRGGFAASADPISHNPCSFGRFGAIVWNGDISNPWLQEDNSPDTRHTSAQKGNFMPQALIQSMTLLSHDLFW
jgi:hypothetical protein